jgi:hypothetical protein
MSETVAAVDVETEAMILPRQYMTRRKGLLLAGAAALSTELFLSGAGCSGLQPSSHSSPSSSHSGGKATKSDTVERESRGFVAAAVKDYNMNRGRWHRRIVRAKDTKNEAGNQT